MKAKAKETLANVLTALKQIKSNPVYIEESKSSYKSTSANREYTGVSVTIPANCFYTISARATYANAKPEEVIINASSTNANSNVATGSYAGVMSTVSHSGMTGSGSSTLYIWAKYSAANNYAGSIIVTGFYIRKSMGGGST